MSTGRKERIRELDVVRALALEAVVLQHTIGVYIRRPDIRPPDSVMLGMLFNISKFAVPAFVFASGAVLFYHYYDRLAYPRFIARRVLDIFVPYFLWTVIYDLHTHGLHGPPGPVLLRVARETVLGSAFYHLWFIVLIFQFYLLFPLLREAFKLVRAFAATPVRRAAVVTAATALYAFLMWLSAGYIEAGHFHPAAHLVRLVFVTYRDRNFLFYSFYFFLGAAAGVALPRWGEFVDRSLGWNTFLFTGLFLWVGYQLMGGAVAGRVNLNYSTSLKPSMFFYTVSEILLVYGLARSIAARSGFTRALEAAGRYSFGAYLVHALVLEKTVQALAIFPLPGSYLAQTTVVWAFTMAGSLALTWLVGRIPYGRILVGPHG